MTKALFIALAFAISAAYAADAPRKSKVAEHKPTAAARSGWDIRKGGRDATRKAPKPAPAQTSRPRQGVDSQGTRAQGIE